jgi:Ca2+-binding RTX toxin-like protein
MVIASRPGVLPTPTIAPITPSPTSAAKLSGPNNIAEFIFNGTEYYNGTSGDDSLNHGGPNRLEARGNDGNDFIWGNNGDDLIFGGNGNDRLRGYDGNDTIFGENGNDTIEGEVGNDSLYGGKGNDNLEGGFGNDYLEGGFGNDTLVGDSGNDRLNGYGVIRNNDTQFDTLFGGAGADTFVLGADIGAYYDETGDGYAVIRDFNYLEIDKIEVSGSIGRYQLEEKSVAGIGSAALDTEIYYLHTDGSRDRIGIVQDASGGAVILDQDFVFV